jgi:general stress protein YciG
MSAAKKDHRCKAKTKSGKSCGAAPTAGGLCFFHANPNKASELGRKGGRSNRRAAGEDADPLPTLDNAIAVRDTVARLIADVYAGRIHPRIAAGLAPLLNLQLRAIETTSLELRLVQVEKGLDKANSTGRFDSRKDAPLLDLGDPAEPLKA